MADKLWRTWVTIPKLTGGGTIPPFSEVVADENDPRMRRGIAQIIGDPPGRTSTSAPPDVAAFLDGLDVPDGELTEPAKPKRTRRKKVDDGGSVPG